MARWACAWVGLVVSVACNSQPGGASSSAAPAPSHATSDGVSAAGSGPATPPEAAAATSASRTPGVPWPNAPLPEGPVPADAPRGALLTLHVTNQSSVTPTIDIQVSVDGRRVVDHVFPYRCRQRGLPRSSCTTRSARPGSHSLRRTASISRSGALGWACRHRTGQLDAGSPDFGARTSKLESHPR